jgi:hypothetical protein
VAPSVHLRRLGLGDPGRLARARRAARGGRPARGRGGDRLDARPPDRAEPLLRPAGHQRPPLHPLPGRRRHLPGRAARSPRSPPGSSGCRLWTSAS